MLYTPNGLIECDNCGTAPTVRLTDPETLISEETLLCGVCFFGDRLMLDPDFWNDSAEPTE